MKLKSQEHKGVTLKEYATLISKQYKDENLDKELKKKLETTYNKERAQYLKQKQEYDSQYGIPKGRVSAYAIFVSKYKGKEEKAVDRMKGAAQQWGKLNPTEKSAYEKESDKLYTQTEKNLSKIEQFKIPEIPRISGYNLFVKEFQPSKDSNGADTLKQASQAWSALTETQKSDYNTRADKLQQQSNQKLNKFCQDLNITLDQLQKLQKKQEKKTTSQEETSNKQSTTQKQTRSRSLSPTKTKKQSTATPKTTKTTTNKTTSRKRSTSAKP